MASGVSSIIKSTPVTDSIVLTFLPSRPMIRPFISSLGREITEIVCSLVTSAAYFCIQATNISLALVSTSSLASVSLSLIKAAISLLIFSSTIFMMDSLACSLLNPLILSNSSNCSRLISSVLFFISWISSCLFKRFFSLSSRPFSLFCMISSRLSRFFSRCKRRSSDSFTSFFFSFISLSTSILSLLSSSFVSNKLSLFILSASFFAFSIIDSAFFSFSFVRR